MAMYCLRPRVAKGHSQENINMQPRARANDGGRACGVDTLAPSWMFAMQALRHACPRGCASQRLQQYQKRSTQRNVLNQINLSTTPCNISGPPHKQVLQNQHPAEKKPTIARAKNFPRHSGGTYNTTTVLERFLARLAPKPS